MFGKQQKSGSDDVIMRVIKDGKSRDVTVKEFVLSQNLSLEALTSVLIRKGLITADELLEELDRIRKAHSERKHDVRGTD